MDGKVALVTGANTGIGLAVATRVYAPHTSPRPNEHLFELLLAIH